jgi:hypothetical protein
VIACHNEIVVECDAGQAGVVAAWLRQAMVDRMAPLIAPLPVVVEVSVGRSWAGEENRRRYLASGSPAFVCTRDAGRCDEPRPCERSLW